MDGTDEDLAAPGFELGEDGCCTLPASELPSAGEIALEIGLDIAKGEACSLIIALSPAILRFLAGEGLTEGAECTSHVRICVVGKKGECMRVEEMRYAHLYNAFFSQYTHPGIWKRRRDDRQQRTLQIVHKMVISCKPHQIIKRYHVTRHLHTLAETQTVGSQFGSQTRQLIYAEPRLAYLAWVMSRLRPLQRKVLDFLWKPNGPMAQRSMRECLTAMRCAAVPA